jgi:hypothetical protein
MVVHFVNAPPGTPYSYITIHLIGTTYPRLMGVPTSEVGYTSATTRRETTKSMTDVVALENNIL